jgi:predicted restriction endonuclease
VVSFWKVPRVLADKADERQSKAERAVVRKQVNERDERQCRCCGSRSSLHQHHMTYRSRGGADTTANLLTLCAVCHGLEHVSRQLFVIGTNADVLVKFEIMHAAAHELFHSRKVPSHVRVIAAFRRQA